MRCYYEPFNPYYTLIPFIIIPIPHLIRDDTSSTSTTTTTTPNS